MKNISRATLVGLLISGLSLSTLAIAASFDPRNATYPLGDCAHLELPPVVKLKNGIFRTPGDYPNTVKVIDVMRGVFDGHTTKKYLIVALSCGLWGANYTYKEYFLLDNNGILIDRLDETRIKNDYTNVFRNDGDDSGLWEGSDEFAFKNGKLTVIKEAGGSHAEPRWKATINYQLDKLNRLTVFGVPTRKVIK
ncbi:hypothetical protein [Burkholderia singularis]|uniref:hypothetical protein n=1 Tax=Burkholderia singularis TaxID=1503053 RepID=UPI000AB95FBB|nr:hypothetical protein [Burkholderia singularis]